MSEQAIKYLRENKEKYASTELAKTLRSAGYIEEDICTSIAEVFPEGEGSVPTTPVPAKQSFWNFCETKVYTSRDQKVGHFLFGLFVIPPLSLFVSGFLSGLFFSSNVEGSIVFEFFSHEIIPFILYIALAVFLFSRRRYIFYGLVIPLATSLYGLFFFSNY